MIVAMAGKFSITVGEAVLRHAHEDVAFFRLF